MIVAILAESPADAAAVRILVDGVLGVSTSAPPGAPSASRGWHPLKTVLPALLRHCYYQLEADGLVVVADSNDSIPHRPDHEPATNTGPRACRTCQLRCAITHFERQTEHGPRKRPFGTAIAMAVPAIEAWYLCGKDPDVTESAWEGFQEARRFGYDRNGLKQRVYGTSRPSIALETKYAKAEASRIVRSDLLDTLERRFPVGFGGLRTDLRSWLPHQG